MINILVTNDTDKGMFISKLLDDQSILGKYYIFTLFSSSAIAQLIKEEEIHDDHKVSNERGQWLGTMSSGERKKAFFQYLITKGDCNAIILDNAFDNLDYNTVIELKKELTNKSNVIFLINIVSRRRDFLDTDQNFTVEGQKLVAFDTGFQGNPFVLSNELPDSISKLSLNSDYLVSLIDVDVSFLGRKILDSICWDVRKGELWQLIGANGAGKTTLLSLITGDSDKAYGQNITLFGYRKGTGESVWDIKTHIGYYTSVMTHNYWRIQSVEHMLVSGFYDSIGLYKVPTEIQMKKAEEWLDFIGLKSKAKEPFIKLGQGHQRLVLIARALVKRPPLVILDEPTADLDDNNTAMVVSLINKMAQKSDSAIIFVSHRVEDDLQANQVFELVSNENGSTGAVKSFKSPYS